MSRTHPGSLVRLRGRCWSSPSPSSARAARPRSRPPPARRRRRPGTDPRRRARRRRFRSRRRCAATPGRWPARISVVVFAFENRRGATSAARVRSRDAVPARARATCAVLRRLDRSTTPQSSLTQYVRQVTGRGSRAGRATARRRRLCSTTADNLFRQARRRAGEPSTTSRVRRRARRERNDATTFPRFYLWGADDRAHCTSRCARSRVSTSTHLPPFAFITPTYCNDGHDCPNARGRRVGHGHVQPVLDSPAVPSGERRGVHLVRRGPPGAEHVDHADRGGRRARHHGCRVRGHAEAWESMLGLPCLADVCTRRRHACSPNTSDASRRGRLESAVQRPTRPPCGEIPARRTAVAAFVVCIAASCGGAASNGGDAAPDSTCPAVTPSGGARPREVLGLTVRNDGSVLTPWRLARGPRRAGRPRRPVGPDLSTASAPRSSSSVYALSAQARPAPRPGPGWSRSGSRAMTSPASSATPT